MPVLPVHNAIAVPDSTIYLRPDYYRIMSAGKEPQQDAKVVLLITKEPMSRDAVTPDSFYPIGITGLVTQPDVQGFVAIRLRSRVNIDEISIQPDKSIAVNVSRRPETEDLDRAEEERRVTAVKEEILKFAEDKPWGALMRAFAANWTNLGEIAAVLSPWMTATNEEKYALLAEDSKRTRFERMEEMIYENLELMKVGNEVRTAQEEDPLCRRLPHGRIRPWAGA